MPLRQQRLSAFLLNALFLLACIAVGAEAQGGLRDWIPHNPNIWHLEVVFDRSGSGRYDKDLGKGGNIHTKSYERTVKQQVRLKACGAAGGLLHIKQVEWELEDDTTEKLRIQAKGTTCPLSPEEMKHSFLNRMERAQQEIRQPGNSTVHTKRDTQTLYPGQNAETLARNASASLLHRKGDHYLLQVGSLALIDNRMDDVRVEKKVCSGHVVRNEHHTRSGDQPSMQITPPTGEDDFNSAMWFTLAPLPMTVGLYQKMELTDQSLSGQRELERKKETHYQETTTASWSLKPKNPCMEVVDRILKDLAFAQAYGDRKIQDFAADKQEYEKLVSQRAYKNYTGRGFSRPDPDGNSGGAGESEVELGVNNDCKLEGDKAFKEKLLKECRPMIIFNAAYDHEMTHVRQCKKNHEAFSGLKPVDVGREEVEAYIVGIESMLSWMKDFCPERDMSSVSSGVEVLRAAYGY
ncbi:MAG: hypothetical protein M3H12_18335 [Chromatiales bacterium]|nr:hypothetical protein [Gammaproteobacteria bacterium]